VRHELAQGNRPLAVPRAGRDGCARLRPCAQERPDNAGRLRRLKEHRVEALARDIAFQGLLAPVVLAETDDGFDLVDGAHRLAALRKLGWAMIPAHVIAGASREQLRFAEIMANVNREDLTRLERAEHLAALKAT
jgi:ParB family chromosome partitioning protein